MRLHRHLARASLVGLALAVCPAGCAASETEPEPTRSSGGDDAVERDTANEERPSSEVLIIGRAGPPPEPVDPPPLPPPPPPIAAARTPAPPLVPDAALAAGDAEYRRATAIVLDVERQPTVRAMVARLVASVRERIAAIGAARDAYREAAGTSPLRALAAIRVADLWDALGADLTAIAAPLPDELEAMLEEDSDALRDEVRRQIDLRVHEAFAPYATEAFCAALASYRAALTETGNTTRATSQIDAYGAELAAHCASTTPSDALAPRPEVSPGEGGASGSASGT